MPQWALHLLGSPRLELDGSRERDRRVDVRLQRSADVDGGGRELHGDLRHRSQRRREPPADAEYLPYTNPDQAAGHPVLGDRPPGEPHLGLREEQEEQGHHDYGRYEDADVGPSDRGRPDIDGRTFED